MRPSANSWMGNATLRLKSLPISGLEEWNWQDDIWVSIQSYNVVIVDASCSLNFKRQLQCKCNSAWPCSRKRTGNAFARGVFIKVDKRTRKKIFICFWKCVDVECKHIAFVTRSTEKNFGVDHKLRRCSTAPSPFKKNLILWFTIGFLRFGFVFADNNSVFN